MAAITTDVTTDDGVRLVCTEYGPCEESAVPVLLLHGLAGHTAEWDALAELLGPAYRLVGYDARGHGRSDRLPEDVSRAAHVRDAVAVAEQLALARPVLIGQSLGGLTALLTAAAHPDPVRALVLVEASTEGPGPRTARQDRALAGLVAGPLRVARGGGALLRRRPGGPGLGGGPGGTPRRAVSTCRPGRHGGLCGGERRPLVLDGVGPGALPHARGAGREGRHAGVGGHRDARTPPSGDTGRDRAGGGPRRTPGPPGTTARADKGVPAP